HVANLDRNETAINAIIEGYKKAFPIETLLLKVIDFVNEHPSNSTKDKTVQDSLYKNIEEIETPKEKLVYAQLLLINVKDLCGLDENNAKIANNLLEKVTAKLKEQVKESKQDAAPAKLSTGP
ncbi:hypothetical protein N9L02_02975, partial [Gammaproteobacteria bacterium]|nr:hypothetical protein [Gammaproteobacteria bacterium]